MIKFIILFLFSIFGPFKCINVRIFFKNEKLLLETKNQQNQDCVNSDRDDKTEWKVWEIIGENKVIYPQIIKLIKSHFILRDVCTTL